MRGRIVSSLSGAGINEYPYAKDEVSHYLTPCAYYVILLYEVSRIDKSMERGC